jgi:hypothetical protein
MRKNKKEPFFIIGCNRSGTSLLRTMINHHPDVAVPLESIFLIDYMLAKGGNMKKKVNLFIHEPTLAEWGLKLNKNDLVDVTGTKDLFDIVHSKYAKKQGKEYWGNKTPRFTMYSLLLKKLYPKSKFVHMLRDPRAVSISLTKSRIHRSNVYFGAKRWKRYVKAGLLLEQKYPKDVLRIYYEDLVSQPEKSLKKVCKFLSLKWDKKMMDYTFDGNSEYRSFHHLEHSGLRGKPYVTKINHWRKELKANEIKVVESICYDLMRKVYYKPIYTRQKMSDKTRYYYRLHRAFTFVIQINHYIFYWPMYLIYTIYRKIRLNTFKKDLKVTYEIGVGKTN